MRRAGRGFTFPVVLADEYVNQVLPKMSIPRIWIVESRIARSEDAGFDNPEIWINRMLSKVQAHLAVYLSATIKLIRHAGSNNSHDKRAKLLQECSADGPEAGTATLSRQFVPFWA